MSLVGSKPARPGQMTETVTFQTLTETSDGTGGYTEAWADYDTFPTVRAQVRAGSGTEALEGDRKQAMATVEFTVRNRSDVSPRDRIVWGGDNYNIRELRQTGARPMFLTILAERGVAQ